MNKSIKPDTTVHCLQKNQFTIENTHRLKSEDIEKGIPCKCKSKESKGSYTNIREIDNKLKTVTRD